MGKPCSSRLDPLRVAPGNPLHIAHRKYSTSDFSTITIFEGKNAEFQLH
ncbi:hypothetical protein E2C01_088552 [Portunus trituberculatus]|uniref:Uncharacterized protein n=1 Tax=Portunus trituberculatus TaxID=210409 RepID=A0A5B7JGW5_PORTR|nr:hypothetical protein [Portunus trituberculatus]